MSSPIPLRALVGLLLALGAWVSFAGGAAAQETEGASAAAGEGASSELRPEAREGEEQREGRALDERRQGREVPFRSRIEGPLKALVDEKAAVIRGWSEAGRIAPLDPHHLIFSIWATTQHYADFEVQIRAVLGDRADEPEYRENANSAVLNIILNGIRPRS